MQLKWKEKSNREEKVYGRERDQILIKKIPHPKDFSLLL